MRAFCCTPKADAEPVNRALANAVRTQRVGANSESQLLEMAARTRKLFHDEKTKGLIAASQLLNRLTKHANGAVEMSASQVQAAKIVIGKYKPDLKAVEHSGNADKPVVATLIWGKSD